MFMPRSLSHLIDPVARRVAGKDWNLYAALLEHWQEIVGADHARVTTPVKITFPHQPQEAHRGNGTLSIRLPKGLAMEFSFKTELIKQRINTYFGYGAISKINLEPVYEKLLKQEVAPVPSPESLAAVREKAASIGDAELEAALASFGESILRGKPRSF